MGPCLPICPVLIPLFWNSNNLIYPVKAMCSRFCIVWFPASPIQSGDLEWFLGCTGCYNQCVPLNITTQCNAVQCKMHCHWLGLSWSCATLLQDQPDAMSWKLQYWTCKRTKKGLPVTWNGCYKSIISRLNGKLLVANHINRWCTTVLSTFAFE